MIKQWFILLAMLFLGEFVAHWGAPYLVTSVAGLLILFILLCLKKVKPDTIAPICDAVTKNMMIFFVVPTVGLMSELQFLGSHLLQILIPVILSLFVGLYLTAKTAEILLARQRKKEGR